MPSWKGDLVQITYEFWSSFYYFSFMFIGNTTDCGNSLVGSAFCNMVCKFHNCTFTFANDNIVYLFMLQHCIRHVRGMPPADYHFTRREYLFNCLSCFEALLIGY